MVARLTRRHLNLYVQAIIGDPLEKLTVSLTSHGLLTIRFCVLLLSVFLPSLFLLFDMLYSCFSMVYRV